MDSKTTIQHNKLMQLEHSMLMYGVYNTETLEKLINTVHHIHNTTSSQERLSAGQQSSMTLRSLYANALGLQHYSIISLLYLRTIQDKYIALYKELITQLHIYAVSIRIFTKGYQPISLITPSKLREILNDVKTAVRKTNPDYDLLIDRLHLYHDMQLVMLGINKGKNLIIQFPVFIQLYTQQPFILYKIETVPVPIIDLNAQAQSYTHLQINKPYIALSSETYISIRRQELRTCKRIGYEFYCEELFVVKHNSKYSCESVIYFNLNAETIKENCNFKFYYNKTDITPTVLDGGNEIILANWPNDKHIMCNINNDILIKIPSHLYVLVNRSVLCNCGTEAENHFLLKYLAACKDTYSKLAMYFTVNKAFVYYLDTFSNLTQSPEFPTITNKTTFEQTLPISLNVSKFDPTLLTAPNNLKEFINSYTNNKEIFDLQERHDSTEMKLSTNKNFLSDNYIIDIFLFITVKISILATTLTVYLLCKCKKL